MDILFRADASSIIGSGHVMRCLTLAEVLRGEGHRCVFVCRDLPGNMIHYLRNRGFDVHSLSAPKPFNDASDIANHGSWPEFSETADVNETLCVLSDQSFDWVVVDHYDISETWECEVRKLASRVMAIDDLADRSHHCELLLDQTYGRKSEDYLGKVLAHTNLLLGSEYVLLRHEFDKVRSESLARRSNPSLKNILVTMGGGDCHDVAGQVLQLLLDSSRFRHFQVTVIVGFSSPWLERYKSLSENLAENIRVIAPIDNMADYLRDADLVIGAPGSSAWERCYLGVPSIACVLADNQKLIANALASSESAIVFGNSKSMMNNLESCLQMLMENNDKLRSMSRNSTKLIEDNGALKVAKCLVGS